MAPRGPEAHHAPAIEGRPMNSASEAAYEKTCDAVEAVFSSACEAIEEAQYATPEARDAAYDKAYADRATSYAAAYHRLCVAATGGSGSARSRPTHHR